MRWRSYRRLSGFRFLLAVVVAVDAKAAAPPTVSERSGADILVQGQRRDDRYRLPVDVRSPPPHPSRRAAGIDPSLACQGVGPMGCGLKPLPILTVGSDGSARVGSADGR